MSDDEFARAIRRGFGRAVLHAQRFGLGPHRELVLSACMRHGARDTQCEDDRSRFLFDVLRAVPERMELFAELRRRIWAVDANDEAYEWEDLSQQARMVRLMAEHGDGDAKPFLYRLMARDPWSHCPAGTAIIALDGFDGLVWVCERLGEALHSGLLEEADRYPLIQFDDIYGEDQASGILEPHRLANELLDHYLRHIEEDPDESMWEQCERMDAEVEHLTLDEMIERLEAQAEDVVGSWFACRRWFSRMDADIQDAFVERAIHSQSLPVLKVGLWLLFRIKNTRFYPALLAARDHEDDHVARLACDALEQVADERVREAAVRGLSRRDMLRGSLSLFVSNFQPEDAAAIADALFVDDDEEVMWRLCGDLQDIAKRHPCPECIPLLLFAYEHQPSTLRRASILELLDSLGCVPEWIKAEAVFDPDDSSRVLALTW